MTRDYHGYRKLKTQLNQNYMHYWYHIIIGMVDGDLDSEQEESRNIVRNGGNITL